MNNLTRIVLLPLTLVGLPAAAAGQSFQLDFQDGVGSWQTVLDGVMGGRSTGRVAQSEPGVMSFTGVLSLENNGGFSQARTAVADGALAGAEGIVLECRGDGRTYKFDVRCRDVRMMAGAFQQDFETKAGEWIEVRLPLDGFRLYSFGRQVRNAPSLDADEIESIGITLSDKNPGDFELQIRSIAAFGSDVDRAKAGVPGDDLVSVAKAAGLTTLLDAVTAAGIALPKSPVTIFAPTNEAFAAIPKATLAKLLLPESRDTLRQILAFHIVPASIDSARVLNARELPTANGQPLAVDAVQGRIAGAGIVAVDVAFDGGIVHVIDKVLMPEQRSISEIAAADKRLSTLVAAASSAGLVRQLEAQNGPWTVFAPVDSAFAKLPAGTVESLLESGNRRKLTQILGLHVVPGRIAARELLAKKRLTSLMGQPLATSLVGGKIVLGESGATILAADIQATNGVIHLIDRVLLPVAKDEAVAADPVSGKRDMADAAIAVYEAAIERGAPLFNDGNPEACAAVYETAIEALILLGGDDLGANVVGRLTDALQKAESDSTPTDRAWTLRGGLDACYRLVREQQQAGEDSGGGRRQRRVETR